MFVKVSAFLLSVFISIQISSAKDLDDLVIELVEPYGKIRGHAVESAKGRGYYAFQDIPYAKPPLGEYRFRPPEIHDDWEGILDCTQNRKICYQFEFSSEYSEEPELKESEDCLLLNVYTPVKPGLNNSLPVYFFIHGGAFSNGEASFSRYGPKYLIDGDIVIVTMNYRLGSFGFLSTGDNEISGNMGLKDQHLALEWTHKNIHLFGGNRNDIVIGGQSAGSSCVGFHLMSPRTKGLASGFLQQSGSVLGAYSLMLGPRKYALELGRALGMVSENVTTLVQILRNASAEDVVTASNLIHNNETYGFLPNTIWKPVIEPENSHQAFLTAPMHGEMMKGNFNRIPSMIGFNSEESLWFLSSNESELQTAAALYDTDTSQLINSALTVENKTLAGQKIKEMYTTSSFEKHLEAFIRYSSDVTFSRSIIRQAEVTSKYSPVYLYQFSAARHINKKYPGISHVLEMRYLWEIPPFAKDTSPVDEEVRNIVLRLWWNFIKYKNPTPEIDPVLQNIKWPTVEPDNIRYLDLSKNMSIESNPRNYNNLRDVLLEYSQPPYYSF